MHSISEADWKILRELKPIALDRLCQRILFDVAVTCDLDAESFHARFLQVFSQIESGSYEIAPIFDDLRRSNAIQRLGLMRGNRLITDREFARFSKPTQEAATRIADSKVFFVSNFEKSR